ncbi:hypothetical protein TYRP_017744 [Tyrophagus putrescentiae]|nr:hypothetical protein TYRP_017744 [Tyrophagus putrescentiae]
MFGCTSIHTVHQNGCEKNELLLSAITTTTAAKTPNQSDAIKNQLNLQNKSNAPLQMGHMERS